MPEVSSGVVKVRVLAAGIAFPDVLVVEGKHMMKRSPPFVPASELCGVVVEVGDDCCDGAPRVGDRVFGTSLTGSLAEFVDG
jgi:NADPH2:quinone reductase